MQGEALQRVLRPATSPSPSIENKDAEDKKFKRGVIRRQRQRLKKHMANLERLQHGLPKENSAISRKVQGAYGPLTSEARAQHLKPSRNGRRPAQTWMDEGFMAPSLLPSANQGLVMESKRSRGGSFDNVQKIALEKALGGTTEPPRTAKLRRQEFYEDVIQPRQMSQASEGRRTSTDLAVAKFAKARDRIIGKRNGIVRYPRFDASTRAPTTKRSYHSQIAAVRASEAVNWHRPADSWIPEVQMDHKVEARTSKSLQGLEQKSDGGDVLWNAFQHFFAAPPYSKAWLAETQNGNPQKLLRAGRRLRQIKMLDEKYMPVFDVWKNLSFRWQQEIWQSVIGLRADDLEHIAHVSISLNKLREAMRDRARRHRQKRPCMRDDLLWDRIVNNRQQLDEHQLLELGVTKEDAGLWIYTRTKVNAHRPVKSALSEVSRSLRVLARKSEQEDLVLKQRTNAALRRGKIALEEGHRLIKSAERELWLFAMGVAPDNTLLRTIVANDIAIEMDDVRAAMAYWVAARNRGGPRPFAVSRSWLLHMRKKLMPRPPSLRGEVQETPRPSSHRGEGQEMPKSLSPRGEDQETPKPSSPLGHVQNSLLNAVVAEQRSKASPQWARRLRDSIRYAALMAGRSETSRTQTAGASKTSSPTPKREKSADQRKRIALLPPNSGRDTYSLKLLQPSSFSSQTTSEKILDTNIKPAHMGASPATMSSETEMQPIISRRSQRIAQRIKNLPAQDSASTPSGQEDQPLSDPIDPALSGAELRRLRKNQRRYARYLEARSQPSLPENSDELWELPHEVGMDLPATAPHATFRASDRLLAPLRRMADDEVSLQAGFPGAEPKLTHLTSSGEAHMVSVAAKADTKRVAVATGKVLFSQKETHKLVVSAALKKGDVLATSRIAGIQAAKMCPSIIPLCHPIMISSVKLDIVPFSREDECGISIEARVECTGPTGVEMEALTGVMGAALTVIDMVKAVDKAASIENVKVVYKSGGKSGTWADEEWRSQQD